ncbi:MAG TPA: sigma 54-interacting transcriptional regulator [Bryobacteraceae bacterium]|nr:sigma 54-interacting transcriptional regulator [Bryobacteraceae bacterium]
MADLRIVEGCTDIKFAPTDSSVLISETGKGKELLVRAIHKRSHRSQRAFVSVKLRGPGAIADLL